MWNAGVDRDRGDPASEVRHLWLSLNLASVQTTLNTRSLQIPVPGKEIRVSGCGRTKPPDDSTSIRTEIIPASLKRYEISPGPAASSTI